MAKSEGRDRGTMYITEHSTVNVQKYFSTSELTEEHQKNGCYRLQKSCYKAPYQQSNNKAKFPQSKEIIWK